MDKLDRWVTLLTNVDVIVRLVVLIYEIDLNTQALENSLCHSDATSRNRAH